MMDMWKNVCKEGKSNYPSKYQNVLKCFGAFQCGTPQMLVKLFEFIKINNTLCVEGQVHKWVDQFATNPKSLLIQNPD